MRHLAQLLWCMACGFPRPAHTLLRELSSENDALSFLRNADQAAVLSSCPPGEATWLVHNNWWSAARELVTLSHRASDRQFKGTLESEVRKEVSSLKQRADELLLALAPQDQDKVGLVRCSFQWAQNSTTLFLSVKFAHRWTSPGALKVHNESANVDARSFHFSADGEHSNLRKRYMLDLQFFDAVRTTGWSKVQAGGYRTVEIQKKEPGKWRRLLNTTEKPKNMGMWESMHQKWNSELEAFQKETANAERKKAKAAKNGENNEDAEAEDDDADEQKHDDGSQLCPDSRTSPFHRDRDMPNLCEEFWPPKMKGKRGRDKLWLVIFFSSRAMGCQQRERTCTDFRDRWQALQKKVSQVAKIGVVNCDLHKEFCDKQELGHLPVSRRYKGGKRRNFHGEMEIDAVMQFLS